MFCPQASLRTVDDVKRYLSGYLDEHGYGDCLSLRFSVCVQCEEGGNLVYMRFHPRSLLVASEFAISVLGCRGVLSSSISIYSVGDGRLIHRLQFVNSDMLAGS